MAPADVITALTAIPGRLAGSDAERRAARLLARDLRGRGRRPRVETLWIRPAWPAAVVAVAVLGVLGTVISVDDADAALVLVGGALVLLALEVAGVPVVRRFTFERATQNVVALDDREAPVRLVVTAAVDTPRTTPLARGRVARAAGAVRRRLGPLAPGPYAILAAALVVALVLVALRARGAEGDVIGVIQLIPVAVLIGALGVALDAWTAQSGPGANANASACAVALELVEALDRRPPSHLAVDVVLAGAGEAHALGFRDWVRRQRRGGRRPEEVAVLEIGPCGAGRPAWSVRDGLVLPLAAHGQLRECARATAEADPALRAGPVETRRATAARAARMRRWPSITISCVDERGLVPRRGDPDDVAEALDPSSKDAALALALGLVARLDREVGAQSARRAAA